MLSSLTVGRTAPVPISWQALTPARPPNSCDVMGRLVYPLSVTFQHWACRRHTTPRHGTTHGLLRTRMEDGSRPLRAADTILLAEPWRILQIRLSVASTHILIRQIWAKGASEHLGLKPNQSTCVSQHIKGVAGHTLPASLHWQRGRGQPKGKSCSATCDVTPTANTMSRPAAPRTPQVYMNSLWLSAAAAPRRSSSSAAARSLRAS